MDKQEINQNSESNQEPTLAEQLADKLFSNSHDNNSDNSINNSNQNSDSNSQSESEFESESPDSKTQAENSIEHNHFIQQPAIANINVTTDDIRFNPSPKARQHSICFETAINETLRDSNPPMPKIDNVKQSTMSNGGFDISFKALIVVGLILLVAAWFTPQFAENIVFSINRGAERAKAEVAKELLANLPISEQRIPWVVKKVAPSVVSIRVYTQPKIGGIGIGTGVIVDSQESKSYILTNHHVIDKARLFTVQFSDGQKTTDVEVVGFDAETDIAVLRVDQLRSPCIEWGDSRKISVGEQVIAIGNPFGLGNTVTSGIISATERYNPSQNGSRSHEMLQTDAAINPGNSGGPLVNLNGELIGINTTIFSHNGGNQGIGFAIPSLLAKHVYDEIRENGAVEHGWLGVITTPTTEEFAQSQGWDFSKGAVVQDFTPFSPAREAGIKRGDVLLKWGNEEIRDPRHLSHLIVLSHAGQSETLELIRKNETKKIKIKLGKRPVSVSPK